MRKFTYRFTAGLTFSQPVTAQYVVLRCLPYPDETQKMLSGSVTVEPWCPMCYAVDGFGNQLMSGSFYTPHASFSYQEEGRVSIDLSKRKAAEAHPMYRHPGLLTHPDEALTAFAAAIPSNDPERMAAAVSEHFTYAPGTTDVRTTAAESFAQKIGVCQDYAQVLSAVARLKGVPARYCMGITEGTGVTHAWTELHHKGAWLGIDPTRKCLVNEGYLRFAVGRDALDCSVERGSFIGQARQTQTVQAVMIEE